MPTGSPSPGCLELSPLLLPTYQWCSCSSWRERSGLRKGGSVHLQERFIGLARCLDWLCPEVALQDRNAGVVDAQRCSTGSAESTGGHQGSEGHMVKRIVAQQALSRPHTRPIIPVLAPA